MAFRKSVNKIAPPGPALETIWDISKLLKMVVSLGNNSQLPLPLLALKVVILLRIDCFARSSDITKLYRCEIKWEKQRLLLRFWRPKEWRPMGTHTMKQWSTWIPIYKVQKHSNRTGHIALPFQVEGNFRLPVICQIAGKNQGHPMTSKQIAQLSVLAMKWAEIPDTYTSRSIRAAAASAAKDYGISVQEIIRQGRWSDAKMFNKYYYRSITRSKITTPAQGSFQDRLRSAL